MATLQNFTERFGKLMGSTKREAAELRTPLPPPVPDPDEELMRSLAGWASDDRGKRYFVPWLNKEMESAVLRAQANRNVPTEQNFTLGFEAGVRHVLARFTKWANSG